MSTACDKIWKIAYTCLALQSAEDFSCANPPEKSAGNPTHKNTDFVNGKKLKYLMYKIDMLSEEMNVHLTYSMLKCLLKAWLVSCCRRDYAFFWDINEVMVKIFGGTADESCVIVPEKFTSFGLLFFFTMQHIPGKNKTRKKHICGGVYF